MRANRDILRSARRLLSVFLVAVFMAAPLRAGDFFSSLGTAAEDAAAAPGTWVPLAVAGIVLLLDADETVTSWASENTPLFGSQESARKWSGYLTGTASALEFGSAALVRPTEDESAAAAKGKALLAGGTGVLATLCLTGLLKEAVGRRRPDGSGADSFPSGHSSNASVSTVLAARNWNRIPLSPGLRSGLDAGGAVLTLGTGWARIEGNRHFLTDVLAGIALGCFIGILTDDLFYPDDARRPPAGQRDLVTVMVLFN